MTRLRRPRPARPALLGLLLCATLSILAMACSAQLAENPQDIIVEQVLPTELPPADERIEPAPTAADGPAPDGSETEPPTQAVPAPAEQPTPVVGDGPFGMQVKRIASDPAELDRFGSAVAISGDRAIVGAYHDGERGEVAGAAYIFERQGPGIESWVEVAKLTASDGIAQDWFGLAVDIEGDLAAVGASHADRRGTNSGAVYLYQRDEAGRWDEIERLIPEDGEAHDWFGSAVALDGSRLAVGASMRSKGMEPPYTLNMGTAIGRVYLFERQSSGDWSEVGALEPAEGRAGDAFGHSVDLDDDTLVVGAPSGDPENVMGGPLEMFADVPPEVLALHSGAVHVFEREADAGWREVSRLEPEDAEDRVGAQFGYTVAVEGTTLAAGAPYDDRQGDDAGTVFLFERADSGDWKPAGALSPDPSAAPSDFGFGLSLDGPRLAVGVQYRGAWPGSIGFVQVFSREAEAWTELSRVAAPDSASGTLYSAALALDDGRLLVGSLDEVQVAPQAGAVHFFESSQP